MAIILLGVQSSDTQRIHTTRALQAGRRAMPSNECSRRNVKNSRQCLRFSRPAAWDLYAGLFWKPPPPILPSLRIHPDFPYFDFTMNAHPVHHFFRKSFRPHTSANPDTASGKRAVGFSAFRGGIESP
jgi:hypothetical protein